MNLGNVARGQVWRRGNRQVEVLGIVEPNSIAPRVKILHWASDGRVTLPLLANFVREYELEREAA